MQEEVLLQHLKLYFIAVCYSRYKVTVHPQDPNVSEKSLDKVLRTERSIYQLYVSSATPYIG